MTHIPRIIVFLLPIFIGNACTGGPAEKSPLNDPCEGIDAVMCLNGRNVPARLRNLLPLAAQWGTGNREEREEIERRITTEEIDLLREALHTRRDAVREWVHSTPPGGRWSREACAFKRMLQLYEDALDMQLRRTLR